MNLVDANILLYAEDAGSSTHAAAREWWDGQISGERPVGLCWTVLVAFVRIATNPRVFEQPLTLAESTQKVSRWLEQPCVRIVSPSSRHWQVLQSLLHAGQATGNLVTDAHLAALSIEHNCVLCSTDADFARFPGLQWTNPLA